MPAIIAYHLSVLNMRCLVARQSDRIYGQTLDLFLLTRQSRIIRRRPGQISLDPGGHACAVAGWTRLRSACRNLGHECEDLESMNTPDQANRPEGGPESAADSLTPPAEAQAPIAGTLPGQHPDVMPDFVFGHLAAGPETTRALVQALSGVQHQFQIDPLRPQAGGPVTIRATTGPNFPAVALWLYYTIDGSRPAGHAGQATTGTAVPMAWRDTQWSELLWDYLSVWEATIPAQPAGAYVRYQIEALPPPGSELAPGFADAEAKAAGGLEPVFAYLVDAPAAPAWIHDAIIY